VKPTGSFSSSRCGRCWREAQKQGATADWAAKQSGRAGRATLLRVFERNGMPCGEIEHVFTVGGGNRYVLPFCRTGDGTWKVAF